MPNDIKLGARLDLASTADEHEQESIEQAAAAATWSALWPWALAVGVFAVGYRAYTGKWFGWS